MAVFLYTRSYLNEKEVEENFKQEHDLLVENGFETKLFSFEEIDTENFSKLKGEDVVYRGWMFNIDDYTKLYDQLIKSGANPITTPEQYKSAHYMPEWVDKLKGLTPETHCFKNLVASVEFVKHHDSHQYFVKDFVKSLKGVNSSIIEHAEELEDWIDQSEFFRGEIEGGICLREIEHFQEDTEQRFFVFNGKITSNNVEVPDIVYKVIDIIDLPFFTVDVVLDDKDEWRVVEIGDGQVSDSSKWSLHNFVEVFK